MNLPTPRANLGIPSNPRPPWWFELFVWAVLISVGLVFGAILTSVAILIAWLFL